MVKVKRENWKHKYIMVARSDTGKILSHRAWKKDFTKRQAVGRVVKTLRVNKVTASEVTFRDDIQKVQLTNVVEITKTIDEKADPLKSQSNRKIAKGSFFQASILIDRRRIFARGKSKQDTIENLARRVSQNNTGGYDEDEGFKFFGDTEKTVKFERVSYADV